MGRMMAALALVSIAGCGDDEDYEPEWITIHVTNQSAEPIWVAGEYEGEYFFDKFSGAVNPGEVGTFTVEYSAGATLWVRVFQGPNPDPLFEAAWSWGGDGDGSPKHPPADIPITIAP